MKTRRRILLLTLLLIWPAFLSCPAKAWGAQTDPSAAGSWVEDAYGWYWQLQDGNRLKNSWLYQGGHWYWLNRDGEMADEPKRIDGQIYYFRESGEMMTGWIYDEENDLWRFADENGRMHRGWLYAGGDWYWFDAGGKLFQGRRTLAGERLAEFCPGTGRIVGPGWLGLRYYNVDSSHIAAHDIQLRGERRPSRAERDEITKVMENVPGYWVQRVIDSGWKAEWMTDRRYIAAPSTEYGIWYIRYGIDEEYKRIRFTDPDALPQAFGELIYRELMRDGRGQEISELMIAWQEMRQSSNITPLPSRYDGDESVEFSLMFANMCRASVRSEALSVSPELMRLYRGLLQPGGERPKPEPGEMDTDGSFSDEVHSGAGPATDPALVRRRSM